MIGPLREFVKTQEAENLKFKPDKPQPAVRTLVARGERVIIRNERVANTYHNRMNKAI